MQSCVNNLCVCTGVFGHGGTNCNVPPGSAPANAGVLAIPLVCALLLVTVVSHTLFKVLTIKGVFKFNAGGKTYVFAWVAFMLTLSVVGFSIGTAFESKVYPVVLALDNLALVFVVAGIMSITSAVIRLAAVRVIRKIPLYKQKSFWAMAVQAAGLIALFYTVDWRVYSYIVFAVLCIAGCCGGIFPVILFIRSVERNPEIQRPDVLKAAFAEYFMRNGASAQFFGLDPRRASKLAWTSAGTRSRESSRDESEIPNLGLFRSSLVMTSSKEKMNESSPPAPEPKSLSRPPSKERLVAFVASLPRTSSRATMDAAGGGQPRILHRSLSMTSFQTDQNGEEKSLEKAIFFLRLIHLGANIFFFMAGFIGSWIGYLLYVSDETAQTFSALGDIPIHVIFWTLRSCFLLCVSYSMILFTQRLFQKRASKIMEERAKLKSKPVIEVSPETRVQIAPWLVQSDTLAKDFNIKTAKLTSNRRFVQTSPMPPPTAEVTSSS